MKEYNLIEKDLLELGWTPKQGNGDHMKFTKPGNPSTIVVSRGVSSRARAYLNSIAEIRRIEPAFRPNACHLKRQALQATDPENGLPEWMQEGCPVRWNGAEGRNWDKLRDPSSVLNIKYVVRQVLPADANGCHRVTIQRENSPEPPFTVSSAELDAWQTAECSVCRNDFPVNVLASDEDDNNLCPDCSALIMKETAEEPAAKESGKMRPGKNSEEIDAIIDDGDKILQKYKDIPINSLPPNVIKEFNDRIKERIDRLPADVQRRLRKRAPHIFRILNSLEDKNNVTPYKAWTLALDTLAAIRVRMENITAQKDQENIRRHIFQTSYSFKKKETDYGRKFDVIAIQTKDWSNAKLIWQCQDIMLKSMARAFPEDHEVILLLECPSENIRQYLTSPHCAIEDALSEDEQYMMDRTHIDWLMAKPETITDEISAFIEEAAGIKDPNDRVNMTVLRNIDDDPSSFEGLTAYYEALLIVDNLDDDAAAAYGAMLEAFGRTDRRRFSEPVRIRIRTINAGPEEEKRFDFFHKEEMETIDLIDLDFSDILLSVYELSDGTLNIDLSSGLETPDDVGKLKERIQASLSRMEGDPRIVLIKQIFNNDTNQENTANMPETNPLDLTNPASGNAAAGALTTRELLRELKGRGVTFQGVEVPVVTRQSVNMDDI